VAEALADLLDALGDGMAGLDSAVKWQAREWSRVLLGEPMASPTIRRTRRHCSWTLASARGRWLSAALSCLRYMHSCARFGPICPVAAAAATES
jgi:hypothetical protein